LNEPLNEFLKDLILALMFAVAITSIGLSVRLRRHTGSLERQLQILHRTDLPTDRIEPLLRNVEARYIALLKHVDQVDTAEFSAGEVETLVIMDKPTRITAAAAQGWIRQTPGILVSLGLLGTFLGLTIGLSKISTILQTQDITKVQSGLGEIVGPMGTAFGTSLVGLLLSLCVLIFTQITGTRTCLERTEALLSSWLETVLPQRLGEKLSTPLRSSLNELAMVLKSLPDAVSGSVQSGMEAAFRSKLDDMFNANSQLTVQAQQAVGQLTAMANSLNESGQDFVEAAIAFRDSSFATTLNAAVIDMLEMRERLTTSSDSLSVRLADVRDGLIATQAEWKLLAAAARQELELCRTSAQALLAETAVLAEASSTLKLGAEATGEGAKQLKEARLEVMRDRKLTLELAEAVKGRLAMDTSVAESCQVFANTLEGALSNWNTNVERLDSLTAAYVASVREAKADDDALLVARSLAAREAVETLRVQLVDEIGAAIEIQKDAIGKISEPAIAAQMLNQDLLLMLEQLHQRLELLYNLPIQPRTSLDITGD
jgi:hypothetical protein